MDTKQADEKEIGVLRSKVRELEEQLGQAHQTLRIVQIERNTLLETIKRLFEGKQVDSDDAKKA